MKYLSLALTFVFLLFISTSCDSDSDSISPGSLIPAKFELPFNNATARKGEEIRVEVSVVDVAQIKNLKVFTKDTVIFEGKVDKTQLLFEIPTDNWSVGTNQISIETTTIDDKVRRDNRVVKIFPNTFPTDYTAEVIKVYPHATTSYTQGLEFDGDQLYEGTGGMGATGRSIIAKVDLNTGEITDERFIGENYFGEGITILGDKLYQLTWQQHTCFVYDKNSLELLDTYTYTGEGWGLCNDGEYLIMSDGTERLYFRDPETFAIRKTMEVYSNQGPLKGINELEYINGKIYANIYTTNQIVIIDVKTGVVTGLIDASLIALDYRETGEVLNGIAYKESTKQLFITGKNWPNMLEIGLIEQ